MCAVDEVHGSVDALTAWAGANGANGSGDGGEHKPKRKVKVTVPKWCGRWVVGMDEFADGVVGAKSKNLAGDQVCWAY